MYSFTVCGRRPIGCAYISLTDDGDKRQREGMEVSLLERMKSSCW